MLTGCIVKGIARIDIIGFQEEEFADTVIAGERKRGSISLSRFEHDSGCKNRLGVPDIVIIVVVSQRDRVSGVGISAFLAAHHLRDAEDIENRDCRCVAFSEIAELIAGIENSIFRSEYGGMIAGCIIVGIAVVKVVFRAEEELAHAVIAGQIEVGRISLALLQDLAQAVEELGVPDIVIIFGVGHLDIRSDRIVRVRFADLKRAVFCLQHPLRSRSVFNIRLCLGNTDFHLVAYAEVTDLHADISFRACRGENNRFQAVGIEEGLVIAVVNILRFAKEEFAHAIVAGKCNLNLILFADLQIESGIVDQLGIPYVIAVPQIDDR